ncbi:MAG: transcription termination/antitermination NusG family protein [Nitrospirota bacterium]
MMDNFYWYAVNTKPRQEDIAEKMITHLGIEAFYPKINEKKGLFPGYLFARYNPMEHFRRIRYTKGVRDIVSYGEYPVPVEDEIIEAIRARMKGDFVQISKGLFNRGDRVIIREGIFKDLEGIFEDVRDSERVIILLNLISYQARVVVEAEKVGRVN